MIGAISALLYQLHDSHTVFIPPGRTVHAIYGFKAQPFADEILVYELKKDGPAAKAGLQLGDRIIGVDNLNAVRPTSFDMMSYLPVLDPRTELGAEIADSRSSRILKIPTTLEPHPKEFFLDYNVIGDKSGGRVNRARIFWEEIGTYDRVAFGTEIAVSRVLMENGEELENRGVTPDEFCVPTPLDLRAERRSLPGTWNAHSALREVRPRYHQLRVEIRISELTHQKRKRPRSFLNVAFIYAGNDLLSHTLSRAVQSALRGLTSVFGMGTGGTPAVRSPTTWSCQLSAVSFSATLCCADCLRANGQQTW